ncbi:hypothetical protein OH146_00150 [Salinibacterium sp. SYSU T00001]|uniref:hypothetical protein n=1 Tax=Homoserinimonas sedimenticola TaxID=2986805 RepID=UPI00223552AC|nr:hypothetical protein [Salinibacterium sedimenticola]MCW4384181.1 hypothetical protein [Salinibacterium sedimenticola]
MPVRSATGSFAVSIRHRLQPDTELASGSEFSPRSVTSAFATSRRGASTERSTAGRRHSRSTLKNTIAALTRVLDEAVRDDHIARNPVRDRADRRYRANLEAPRTKLIPGPDDVVRIAEACTEIQPSYGDHVLLSAFLAARGSEVGGLLVGNVDWASKVITIERQCFPVLVA